MFRARNSDSKTPLEKWNQAPGTDFRLKSLWCIFFDAPCTIYRKIMNFVYIFNKQHRVGPLSPFCDWVLNLKIYLVTFLNLKIHLATFLNLKIYLVPFLNHKSTFLSPICIETDAPVTSRIPLISGSLNLYKF